MAGIVLGLKESVAFKLTYKPTPTEALGTGIPMKNWIMGKDEGVVKQYDYFIPK